MEELETALALSGQPVKRGTMAHRHIIYMMLTEAAAHLRDASALQRYALSLEELAERDEHRPYLAVAHRACGIAHRLKGEFARAENRLANALELFNELEMPWQVGRTLAEIAELAQAQSDETGARDHFSRALSEFEALRAMPAVEQTQAALDALA